MVFNEGKKRVEKIEMSSCKFGLFLHEKGLLHAGHKMFRKIVETVQKTFDFDKSKLSDEWMRVNAIQREVEKKV